MGLLSWGRSRRDALAEITSEWRETLDAIEWPILALHLDGRIARLNRAAQRLAGLEFNQLRDRPVGAIGSWQPWQEIAEMARSVAGTRAGLSSHVRGDRSKAWHITASFAPRAALDESRIIVVARDVTDVARLEAQLRRSETMAAMGSLVSGVAHEVRNPLFAISATIDALEARLGSRDEIGPFATVLRGEVERLGRLMRDLLDFGKPSALELAEVDVGDVVASGVRACESLAVGRNVAIHNRVQPGLARVRLDPSRVSQVVQNLVENALHYSPPGSSVDIQGAVFPANAPPWLEISVGDRGPGFRPDDLPKIFEPFYTRRRGGTGLGLSIVKRIVEAHGGTVDAANRPDSGAIMTLGFPLASGGEMGDSRPHATGGEASRGSTP